jgi:hypothetical protein
MSSNLTRALGLTLVCLLVTGCRHRQRVATVAGPGMNSKREAALMEQAGARLGCSRSELLGAFEASLESNYHVYRVDGCGKRFYALLHCTGVCNWREAPEMRAEGELQCPVTQLARSYTPHNHVFVISGCGRTVAYELGQGHLRPVQAIPMTAAPVMGPPPPSTSPSTYPPPPPPPPPPAP